MSAFLKFIGRSLLLPLAVLPIGTSLLILGAPAGLDIPIVAAAGSLILQHMALFLAIGIAVTMFRKNRGIIALATTVAYVLVMVAARAAVAALSYLAESNLLTQQWLTFAVIVGFFVVCYGLIYVLTQVLNLRGSDRKETRQALEVHAPPSDIGESYIYALGSEENIIDVDNCATRMIVTVKDSSQVDDGQLKALGANGVVKPSSTAVQVNVGLEAEFIANAVRDVLRAGGAPAAAATVPVGSPSMAMSHADEKQETESHASHGYDPAVSASVNMMITALGGESNILDAGETATTRVRVVVHDESLVNEEALRAAGASGVMTMGNTFHILLGMQAKSYGDEMQERLEEERANA